MLAVFLDIETTGLDFLRHKPIDIALHVVDVSKGKKLKCYQALIAQSEEVWKQSDPISLAVNGYTFEQISLGKQPSVVALEIKEILTSLQVERGKAVFICQNPAFDRGFFTQLIDVYTQESLQWPYHWLDFASMYWALLVKKNVAEGKTFPDNISLSKNQIAKVYHLPEEASPHRAISGVEHLMLCYQVALGVTFD